MPSFSIELLSLEGEPGQAGNRRVVEQLVVNDREEAIHIAREWVQGRDLRRADVRDEAGRVAFYASRRGEVSTEFQSRRR